MSELSNVDAAKIRAAAQKLADIDTQVIANVRKLLDAMSTLDKGWQSEVKAQFMQVWQEDSEALAEMIDQLGEMQELLTATAEEFEATEDEMIGEVGKLK